MIIRIRIENSEGYTSLEIPKALASVDVVVNPKTGAVQVESVYQNSGGAVKFGDLMIPNDMTVRIPK